MLLAGDGEGDDGSLGDAEIGQTEALPPHDVADLGLAGEGVRRIEWAERETMRRALAQARGVKKDAAELMGISQRALSHYLAKYRIDE